MPIAAGDALAPGAIAAYRRAAAETESCVIYADDDVLDDRQNRTNPHFKPGWNSELFRHFDYLTSSCMVRAPREAMEAVAGADDWAQRITAQMAEEGAPLHIPKVLHHRRSRPGPRLAAPSPADPDVDLPLVTVIIPTRNRVDLLRTCLEGVAATDYPAVEVIIVDNDSDDQETLDFLDSLDPVRYRVLRYSGPFNYSAINNHAVAQARGQLLCLLNNDIEVMEPDWLSLMVAQAIRDNVGAVGARLLYPDGRIQHAGVVMGMGHAAGHAHRLLRPDDEGYFHRHSLPQFVSAVTAACLVVQRGRFLSVGGLDAQNFAVAFNDVDLCLRLNKRGWQSFYEPRATLIHHESVSRGFDRDPVGQKRFAGELAALQRLWGTETIVDPYHHPELSRASETFVVRL
ncbi:MAG TPA: glycosyltransferase family 2 protein [Sphingobium sp.]|uniref:glycosyltransferase family 2 protein n=1 Tax=Sphingobium sp. TaxID=1912891 RepID=UPI002ED2D57E